MCCYAIKIAKLTKERFEENKLSLTKYIDKIGKHLKNNTSNTIKFPKLDKTFLSLQVYSKARFATNQDLSLNYNT